MIGNKLYHTPGCLEVHEGCLEVGFRIALRSMRVASRSHASRSQGTNFETKIFNFRCFLALPTETSFTTPHYYPKYGVWAIDNFLWQDPFKEGRSGLNYIWP